MTEYQSGRSMNRWLMVHIALVDTSSGSRTVSRQISKRATSRPYSSNPWHWTRVIGEPPAAAPSPNSKTTEYTKLPKGQAAANRSKLKLMPGVKVASISHGQFNCDVCSRIYVSRIGDEIRHIDGSLHHQDRLAYDIDRVSNSYVFL